LEHSEADSIAMNDLIAFQTIMQPDLTLAPEAAEKNATRHASDLLEGQCQEFQDMLSSHGDEEEYIHQWLRLKKNQVFLDPQAVKIWSKLPFGDQDSDFVIKHPDGTYTLVEIERANIRIFRADNSEPTAPFNHACQQVRDWQRYVRDNVHTIRSEVGLDGIYEPRGMVVIGRSNSISTQKAQIRWRDMKSKQDPSIFTYDELCDNVRSLAITLRNTLALEN